MFVFKAAVVGAGTMGGEIAQVIASAGIPVVLKDVKQEFVDLGLKKAEEVTRAQLGGLVHKQKITQEQADQQATEVLGRITGTTEYEGFGDVDFVIEAVPERMEIKQAVLAELDALTPGHAILASNTSALSITEMADATSRPDKVVGFHFFYPASFMRLVEVVEGVDTSPETMQIATTFAQTIRKLPITCGEEPGFVVNRILNSAISEIWRLQEANSLSIKAIDDAVSAAGVAPMGPFFLTDLLGLDTVLHVAEHLQESYGSQSFYVHQGMKALVEVGELGAKTGKGFYENGEPRFVGETEFDADDLTQRFVLKALVEACLLLEDGMATVRDIDLGMMAGAGLIPPPFARADQTGLDNVLAELEHAAVEWGEQFAPPLILRRLVAQGRLGTKSGQGFFAYKQPDEGFEQGEAVAARDARRLRDRLAGPPAGELAVAAGHQRARQGLGPRRRGRVDPRADHRLRESDAVVRGRRHQGVHAARRRERRGAAERRARPAATDGAVLDDHDRGHQRRGLRRRLRAGDGLRRADRGAVGELRAARDQPRDHPRLRWHPAAATPRGDRASARAEPHRRPDLRRRGLRDRARQPRRARPRAARRGSRMGTQARRPGAARGRRDQAHDGRRRRSRRGHRGREGRLRRDLPDRGRARRHRRVPR